MYYSKVPATFNNPDPGTSYAYSKDGILTKKYDIHGRSRISRPLHHLRKQVAWLYHMWVVGAALIYLPETSCYLSFSPGAIWLTVPHCRSRYDVKLGLKAEVFRANNGLYPGNYVVKGVISRGDINCQSN